MSKTAQRNQSAFNIGRKIGEKIAKKLGSVYDRIFSARFKNMYKGHKSHQGIAFRAARIGYANELDKAAKAAYLKTQDTQLTGGKDA